MPQCYKGCVALKDLTIENMAVIAHAHLHFSDGLNILTGETGAGKSMILEVIELILGAKAAGHLIRQGCDSASCEARFSFADASAGLKAKLQSRLEKAGIVPDEDGDLIIRRTLQTHKDGIQGRIFLNGQLATRSTLQGVCEGLVDISSQHDQQRLLKSGLHRQILDEFIEADKDLESLGQHFRDLKALDERYRTLTENSAENLQRRDFLQFQIQELENLNLQKGEMEGLSQTLKRLSNQSTLRAITDDAVFHLDQKDQAVLPTLHALEKQLERALSLDTQFERPLQTLREAILSLQETTGDLSQTTLDEEDAAGQMAELEKRMADLHRLERKYGQKLDAIIDRLPDLQAEFAQLHCSDEDLAALKAQGQKALAEFLQKAEALSQKRRGKTGILEKLVEKSLGLLAMPKAKFQIDVTPAAITDMTFPCDLTTAGMGEWGIDHVEFRIAPNPGQGFFPLGKIASGGELSRILLALRTVLAPAQDLALHFFDEIDAGIGGETAMTVGHLLKKISQKRQVLCITHLPQIACFADQHFKILKQSSKAKTQTTISQVTAEERVDELARMLGGENLTSVAKTHARELLAHAG